MSILRTAGHVPAIVIGVVALALAASSEGAVTFLGQVGSNSNGLAVVGFSAAGVPDSTTLVFGMTPDLVYSGQSFTSPLDLDRPDLGMHLSAHSSLEIAAAGPADRALPVATGGLTVTNSGTASAPDRHARATLDFSLRYVADQPTIYWALLEIWPTDVVPGEPLGNVLVSHPPAEIEGSIGGLWFGGMGWAGSAPNTGQLDISASAWSSFAGGLASDWWYYGLYKVYLASTPLNDLVTGVPAHAPARVTLSAPRPNPARGGTVLDVALPHASPARLEILDVTGRHVRTLVAAELPAGTTSVKWDGADQLGANARAGVYFARLVSGGTTRVRRLVLMP